MKWRAIVTLMLILLVANVLPLSVTSTNTNRTIYVDDDNWWGPWDGTLEYPYQFIQDGIKNAEDGDTVYVFNGSYIYGEIFISKSINLIGENKETTVLKGNNESLYFITIASNNVIIDGFTIIDGFIWNWPEDNISIDTTSNLTITNNTICCPILIMIINANNILIENNNILYGMAIIESGNNSNNIIRRNEIKPNPNIETLIILNEYVNNVSQFIENNLYLKNKDISILKIPGIIEEKSKILNYLINEKEQFKCFSWKFLIENIIDNKFNRIKFKTTFQDSRWQGNYWDRTIHIFPKVLIGMKYLNLNNPSFMLPFLEFDLYPAKEPYDIPITEVTT